MRNLKFSIILVFGAFCPISFTYAHFYESIGVEAETHTHEEEEKASSQASKCFDDPKFGLICK